jgi:indolepyruvate ferredoxin oxidoreductase
MFSMMRILAKLKFLRGTAFDVFGYSGERRTERALVGEYERTLEGLLATLDASNLPIAVEIASIPEQIRGYGPVKRRHLAPAKAREAELLEQWRSPEARQRAIPIRVAA